MDNAEVDIELQNRVLELKNQLGSFLAVSKEFGGSAALYWRIANRQIKTSRTARKHLGLSQRDVLVTPCSCGELHTLKHCPKNRRPSRKQFTVAFRFDDECDAVNFRRLIGGNRTQWAKDQIDRKF